MSGTQRRHTFCAVKAFITQLSNLTSEIELTCCDWRERPTTASEQNKMADDNA